METLEAAIARIDERTMGIDKRLEKIESSIEKVDNKLDRFERRTDSLENWRSRMKGSIAIISIAVTTLTGVILKFIGL